MPHRAIRAAGAVLLAIAAGAADAAQAQETADAPFFEIDALNAGLGAPPEIVVRETPRDALEAFLGLTAQGRLNAAAHLLNLNEIDPADQPAHGARLARMLSEVIDRRIVLDWRDTPSRPDAIDETLPSEHPFAGKPRRSLRLASLDIDDRPMVIRINRVKPANGDPVWVVSRQTVGAIPTLHEAFGPTWLERAMPEPLKADLLAGVRAWEMIALPILLAGGAGLMLLLRRLLGRLGAQAPAGWIRRAASRFRTPLAIAGAALILQILISSVFSFSGAVTVALAPVLLALMIFGFTFAALRTIDATLEIVTERYIGEIDSSHDSEQRHLYTNIYALRRYVLLAAFLISTVLLLYQLSLFESFGLSLLASAGLATVILGIAGQSILGNILASLQIAIAKPIRIGDSVLYEDRWAYVESIYYTFTVLKTWDERRLIVPVKYFISKPFENWTMIDAKTVRSFSLKLDLSAEPAALREVFEDLVKEDKDAMLDEMLLVAVDAHDERTQTISFYATAETPSDAWLMQARLAERLGDWIRENRPEWWPALRLEGAPAAAAGSSANGARQPERTDA